MVVKSFRGLLADGAEEKLNLHTPNGKHGYRITKLELITETPGQVDHAEHIVKINKTQTTVDGVIDFSDNALLAAGITFNRTDASQGMGPMTVIFDQEIFNQDIFITHFEAINAIPCNYYLELELITLSDFEAQAAILKSIRTG